MFPLTPSTGTHGKSMNIVSLQPSKQIYRIGPKSKPLLNYQKNRIKSYESLPMGLDIFVTSKYQSINV